MCEIGADQLKIFTEPLRRRHSVSYLVLIHNCIMRQTGNRSEAKDIIIKYENLLSRIKKMGEFRKSSILRYVMLILYYQSA